MRDKPISFLFTTLATGLIRVPQWEVDIEVTACEGQVALLQSGQVERVPSARRSERGHVGVVECGLGCGAFLRRAVGVPNLL